MKPRWWNSAPAWPMNTMPLPTRGAPVMDMGSPAGMVSVSQTLVPFFASMATRRPSSVPQIKLPCQYATPRLELLQHRLVAAISRGTFGSYFHRNLPLAASKAYTLLHGVVT